MKFIELTESNNTKIWISLASIHSLRSIKSNNELFTMIGYAHTWTTVLEPAEQILTLLQELTND